MGTSRREWRRSRSQGNIGTARNDNVVGRRANA